MEWIYYLICIIAIGFICVMGPILTLIYTFMMPWYVIMAYFAWIALSLLLISKLQKKDAITITVILTFIFSMVFRMSIQNSNLSSTSDDEGVLEYLILPALNLPAILYFGFMAKRKTEKSKINKINNAKQDAIQYVDKRIKNITIILQVISDIERDYKSVSDLLCLFSRLDRITGKTLVDKYNSIQNASFSRARTLIMLKLPESEKACFPNNYSDLSRYKGTIEKERLELNRYKETIPNCNSSLEIKKIMKKIQNNALLNGENDVRT